MEFVEINPVTALPLGSSLMGSIFSLNISARYFFNGASENPMGKKIFKARKTYF